MPSDAISSAVRKDPAGSPGAAVAPPTIPKSVLETSSLPGVLPPLKMADGLSLMIISFGAKFRPGSTIRTTPLLEVLPWSSPSNISPIVETILG